MATYGINFYGADRTRYGPLVYVEFDATPVIARPLEYGRLFVTWNTPVGIWQRLRLVRNSYGFPVDEKDGTILVNERRNEASTSFHDSGLSDGRFFYYGVFVHGVSVLHVTATTAVNVTAPGNTIGGRTMAIGEVAELTAQTNPDENGYWYWRGPDVTMTRAGVWTNAGNAMGLTTFEHGFSEQLWNRLPNVYREADEAQATEARSGPLKRFLQLFGFQLDHIRTEYDSLRRVSDPDNVAGTLLPMMGQQFNMPFEPALGMRLHRIQLRNAVHIYKTKGTRVGVKAAVTAFTGWGADVFDGVNLLLTSENSSFENTIGSWVARTNCTLSRTAADNAPHGGYALQMTSTGAGDMVASMRAAGTEWLLHGLHVTPGKSYAVSAYFRSVTNGRVAHIDIEWLDKNGALVATTPSAAITTTTTGWTQAVAAATPPATAAYVNIVARVLGETAGGAQHLLDAVQFEEGTGASPYQVVRDVRIKLAADRVNFVTNPSFEVNTNAWHSHYNVTLARSTAQAYSGGASLAVTANETRTDDFNLVEMDHGTAEGVDHIVGGIYAPAGNLYSASLYTRPDTTVRTVRLRVDWRNTQGTIIRSDYGPWVTQVAGAWVRLTREGMVVPADANHTSAAVQVRGITMGEIHYIDAVLFERSPMVGSYFDASVAPGSSDYLWGGTAHASISHYYARRSEKDARLRALLPQYLPAGASFTLIYAEAPYVMTVGMLWPDDDIIGNAYDLFPGPNIYPA